jgi:molecular chaperone GrpE (heat shock protein)
MAIVQGKLDQCPLASSSSNNNNKTEDRLKRIETSLSSLEAAYKYLQAELDSIKKE